MSLGFAAPWLAILGGILIASPIIIHLLNKRRFKIVDWAAMDFLLDADKRNRRRVRLENLLLLLLRCAAVALLGLMLAKPFLGDELAARLLQAAQYEHIVVLDDSLSTQVLTGNQTAFAEAKQRLVEMVRGFVDDRNDDTFTLILTSLPDERQANGVRVTKDTIDELVATIEKLEPSDGTADLGPILKGLEDDLRGLPRDVNRIVYLVSDLRERDWGASAASQGDNTPAKILTRLAKATSGAVVLDIGGEEFKNVAITDIRPEGVLVAGVVSRFDVTVANFSTTEARDLTVKFKAGEALPLEASIERIPPGQTASVPFSFTFSAGDEMTDSGESKPLEPVRISVEVVSTRPADEDRLLADSVAYFPARVVRGIPTLIVDGDPSSDEQRSESYYLKHALQPFGPILSGVTAEIVHETEMETTSLSKYQVIFLCNVYRFSEKTLADLEAWVRQGGGLVIMPGDQVDEAFYNKVYFRDGAGLSPVRLEGILGDETRERWVQFKIEQANHPVLGVFEGQTNPSLELTKVFRWWNTSTAEGQLDKVVDVAARFSDADSSIAMAEKRFGDGRVMFIALPADADWHLWPIFPTYVVSMQELVRHMGPDVTGSGSLRVGEPLVHTIDLSDYKTDAELRAPREKKVNLQAREPGAANGRPSDDKSENESDETKKDEADSDTPTNQTQWQLVYDETSRRGFYELLLSRNDGVDEKLLYAANADPGEGNLARVDQTRLRETFGDAPIRILSASQASSLAGSGSQRDLWMVMLIGVVVILSGEQLLAWAFGLRR